jgi:hypothetical protein
MRKDEQFVVLKPDKENVIFVRLESIVRVKTQAETSTSAEVLLSTGERIVVEGEEARYLRTLLVSQSIEEVTGSESASREGPAP